MYIKERRYLMYKSILPVVVIIEALILATPADAVITFERTYGGIDWDMCSSVQETRDGGYIIAGRTKSFGAGQSDVYLIKTDAAGDTVWTQTYGGTGWDFGSFVQETRDGGYIIAGSTCSFGAGECDVYLIKTDAAGDTVWTKTYGSTYTERGNYAQETQDGGFIVVGETISLYDMSEIYLIKTDAAGDTVWTKTYGGTLPNYDGSSVQETQDGGYVIAGWTGSINSDYSVAYLIKTDDAGNTVWTKTYGDTGWDNSSFVQETQDGGFIIVGETLSLNDRLEIYLIKTDTAGDTVWTQTYGGTGWDYGSFVQETQDGGYIIAGRTESFGAGRSDVYLIKTDAAGDTVWTQTYGGIDWDMCSSVQETRDGGFIIAGSTCSFGAGEYDVYLIKTNAQGNTEVEIE